MSIRDHVVSYETAVKLTEAGFKKETSCYYCGIPRFKVPSGDLYVKNKTGLLVPLNHDTNHSYRITARGFIAAPLLSEILAELPECILLPQPKIYRCVACSVSVPSVGCQLELVKKHKHIYYQCVFGTLTRNVDRSLSILESAAEALLTGIEEVCYKIRVEPYIS